MLFICVWPHGFPPCVQAVSGGRKQAPPPQGARGPGRWFSRRERGPQRRGLRALGSRGQLPHRVCDLPRRGRSPGPLERTVDS